jgi:uncharacterized protein (DUF1786 family)
MLEREGGRGKSREKRESVGEGKQIYADKRAAETLQRVKDRARVRQGGREGGRERASERKGEGRSGEGEAD